MEITAAITSILLLIALAIFQVALVKGKPWENMRGGGQHVTLPTSLRIASVSSIVIYFLIILVIVDRVGFVSVLPDGWLHDNGIWILVVYFGLGIFMNLISRSVKERLLMTPVVMILFICVLLLV